MTCIKNTLNSPLCSLCPLWLEFLLRPHVRKEDHVADRVFVGQQHHEPVDADADAGGGRHAVAEGTDVVFVEDHRLFVAAFAFGHLIDKAFVLLLRIVQFAKTVRDLHAVDEQLETLGDIRVIRATLLKSGEMDFG